MRNFRDGGHGDGENRIAPYEINWCETPGQKWKAPDLGGKVRRLSAFRACAGREAGAAGDIFG